MATQQEIDAQKQKVDSYSNPWAEGELTFSKDPSQQTNQELFGDYATYKPPKNPGAGGPNSALYAAVSNKQNALYNDKVGQMRRDMERGYGEKKFNELSQAGNIAAMNMGAYQQQWNARQQQLANQQAQRSGIIGAISGIVGAGAGFLVGGPAGAGAGYQVGAGLGGALS